MKEMSHMKKHRNLRKKIKILYFEETSAKTGINAKEVFTEAAKILLKEHNNYRIRPKTETIADEIEKDIIPQKLENNTKKRNKGCC